MFLPFSSLFFSFSPWPCLLFSFPFILLFKNNDSQEFSFYTKHSRLVGILVFLSTFHPIIPLKGHSNFFLRSQFLSWLILLQYLTLLTSACFTSLILHSYHFFFFLSYLSFSLLCWSNLPLPISWMLVVFLRIIFFWLTWVLALDELLSSHHFSSPWLCPRLQLATT